MTNWQWEIGAEETEPPYWVALRYCMTCGFRKQWLSQDKSFTDSEPDRMTRCPHCGSAAIKSRADRKISANRREGDDTRFTKKEGAFVVALKRIRQRWLREQAIT